MKHTCCLGNRKHINIPPYISKEDIYEEPRKVIISKNHAMSYERRCNGNVLILSSDEEKLGKWTNDNILLGVNSLILCKDSSKHDEVCKTMKEKGYSVHIVKVEYEESDNEDLFKALFLEEKQIVVADVSKIDAISAAFLQLFLKVAESGYATHGQHIHVYLEDNMVMDWLSLPGNDLWIDHMVSISSVYNISYRILANNIYTGIACTLVRMRQWFLASIVLGRGNDGIWGFITEKGEFLADDNKAYVFTDEHGLFEDVVL